MAIRADRRVAAVDRIPTLPTDPVRPEADILFRRTAAQNTTDKSDGLRAVGEYDGAGDELRRFVYGAWIDEPVCMSNGTDRYFFHHDRLGTVAALADSAGALAEKYRYTPFGGVETASALGNPYYFTGRRLDEETGLYYYRARMYDPALARFLQPDPIARTEISITSCDFIYPSKNPLT